LGIGEAEESGMAEGRGEIAAYEYGASSVARSPVGLEELELLKQTVLFGEEDEEYLRMAGDVFEDQVEDVLDVWYGFVADHQHLVRYFSDSEGQPDGEYLGREQARERNLSPIQAQFLVYLLHHTVELRRVSQLAREFDLTQATVSDAVASLETKGFVRREQWPEDRRVVTLRLTPDGEELARSLSDWADPLKEHLERFSPGESEAAMSFLMGLTGSLQRSGLITVARMCVTCRFFRRDVHPGNASPHHCGLLDVPLGGHNLRVDCPEHEAAAG
jgi:DNA-binding MarR family transcriptional regulator